MGQITATRNLVATKVVWHAGQWCGALKFSLICKWINGWVNNREASDLRHQQLWCHGNVLRPGDATYRVINLCQYWLGGPDGTRLLFDRVLMYCQLVPLVQIFWKILFTMPACLFQIMHFNNIFCKWSAILFLLQCVNSLRPSDAYMRQQTNHHWFRLWLVALLAPSHYLNQCWNIVNWTIGNKSQWNLKWNSYIFTEENAFENVVWKMVAILSRPQCVNWQSATYVHIKYTRSSFV